MPLCASTLLTPAKCVVASCRQRTQSQMPLSKSKLFSVGTLETTSQRCLPSRSVTRRADIKAGLWAMVHHSCPALLLMDRVYGPISQETLFHLV